MSALAISSNRPSRPVLQWPFFHLFRAYTLVTLNYRLFVWIAVVERYLKSKTGLNADVDIGAYKLPINEPLSTIGLHKY